jgi:predicted secreted hydrolase
MRHARVAAAAIAFGALILLATILFARSLRPRPAETTVQATLELQDVLGGADTTGFERAFSPRPFEFPRDHGAHSDFRTEWWYVTGNLEDENGRRFGYQLTFFRSAVASTMPERASAWATRQAWMAHFTLTDPDAGRFVAHEKFARGAAGLAGAQAAPFRVWLGPWSMQTIPGSASFADSTSATAIFPVHLVAAESDVSIDLELREGKPLVPQGDRGLSRKGPEPGNASYYFSFTRMPTAGTVRTGAETWRVTGESWLDREWSTSALSPGIEGWDWFALQLGDSTELMFYRLRRAQAATDSFSAGTFVDSGGTVRPLSAHDIEVRVLDHWKSARDQTEHPSRWRLRVPSLQIDLEITPVLPDQELNVSIRYWEGAVNAVGTRGQRAVRGRGYVELTGYAERAAPGFAASRSGRVSSDR